MNPTPFTRATALTLSDSADLAVPCRALYIGVTGDVSLIPANGTTAVVFKAVPVGMLHVSAKRVRQTGTTATDIVALS